MNPDCRAGKCDSCAGDGWDEETDQPAPCSCPCHDPGPKDCEDRPGCPATWHYHDCTEDNGDCDAEHLHTIAAGTPRQRLIGDRNA